MYSKAISWIDDCRIPFVDDKDKGSVLDPITGIKGYKHTAGAMTGGIARMIVGNPKGRSPANILVSDDMLNDGTVSSQSSGLRKNPGIKTEEWKSGHKNNIPIMTQGDKGSNSRYYDIDKWFNNLIDV
jgi:hypothetical protein